MPNPTTIIELEGLTLSELIQLREQIQGELLTKIAMNSEAACEVNALKNLDWTIQRKRSHTIQL